MSRRGKSFTMIFYGLLVSVLFATLFFTAGAKASGVGWLILGINAAQAAALWLPFPWAGRRALTAIARTVTARRLSRVNAFRDSAKQAWEDELAAYQKSLPFWKRLRLRLP